MPHPRGGLKVREVFIGCFYFRVPNLKMASEVDIVIGDFVRLLGPSVSLRYFDDEGEPEELTQDALDSIKQQRLTSEERLPNATIELSGDGLYAPAYYLWYNGKALDIRPFEAEASYLWFWLPRELFLAREREVRAFLESCSSMLPFSYGYASLGLSGEDRRQKQALANRHPGLDIAFPGAVSADLADKAAGAYWLNFLSADMCIRLGGVETIRRNLPANVIFQEKGGGACEIQLTRSPEIGDVNRREILPEHRAFAKYLNDHRLLHVPERVVYFRDADGVADREAMENWHRRFVI